MSESREPTGGSPPKWPHARGLVHGDADDPLFEHLRAGFTGAHALDIAVAFVMDGGVKAMRSFFVDLLEAGGRLRILTGDYFGVSEPTGLSHLLDLKLLDLPGSVELRVFETAALSTRQAFHPKTYIFHYPNGEGIAFIGSSNLSRSALIDGVEWNYRVVRSSDAAGFASVTSQFDRLLRHPKTTELTSPWIQSYRERRSPDRDQRPIDLAAEEEEVPGPLPLQRLALSALRETRAQGNNAGLVVLATGLGKTWLSAFDAQAFAEERGLDLSGLRVLFVAHRKEILDQALETFRRIRPTASLGRYTGEDKDPGASFLFASIATLHRSRHRELFPPDHFHYVVVDEFHHAEARTYRELIEYFRPGFLLGLTATPERTDGADLLALCGHNLVFRTDLGEGVRSGALAPFEYFGVPDGTVDYDSVPWRRGRFVDDNGELTQVLATEARAVDALDNWRRYAGTRGLGFCCSVEHADYMAQFFRAHGLRAVAVHSKPSSAPRTDSLLDLEAGKLDVIFCVDMFNEGVDLPHIDTVLMLRPTESRILWLQQFGRGLRHAAGKVLKVVDYIGNHKVFLTKVHALLSTVLRVGDSPAALREAIFALRAKVAELPEGCAITYDLEVVDVLSKLLAPTTSEEQLRESYEQFRREHERRPTARELFMSGSLRRPTVQRAFGSWFGLVDRMGDLSYGERQAWQAAAEFLAEVESSRMERSYKMLVLEAMLEEGCMPGSIEVSRMAQRFSRIVERSGFLREELKTTLSSGDSLEAMLRSNPLRAWTGTKRGKGSDFFELEGDVFRTKLRVAEQVAESDLGRALAELVRELVEWRLAEYLERRNPTRAVCRVIRNASGSPIIMLDRKTNPELPHGPINLTVEGGEYEANFVKIALNTLYSAGDSDRVNQLAGVLRKWFGSDVGAAGHNDLVRLEMLGDIVELVPHSASRSARLEVGRSYMREEIPQHFGVEFNASTWRQGIVAIPSGLALLVTLDKAGKQQEHKYEDRFLSPKEFQWQSQNQTRQQGKHGRLIRGDQDPNRQVHLFVRKRPKLANQTAAPFVYIGTLEFLRWEGEKPITVWWRLESPLHDELWSGFG